jgi:YD repeat-containing protein
VRLVELASPNFDPPDPNDPDPPTPPEQSPARKLVGIDYSSDWFDGNGRGTARVTASWYGAIGQKNASLTLLSAHQDSQNDIHLSYTIDRFEHNNFGQMVLEHRYGYEVAAAESDEDIDAAAVFLGGTAYSYEMEGWVDPQSSEPPPIFVSTKVRRIMPLTEGHGAAIVYDPDARRHTVDWANSTDPQLSTVIEYNAPVVEPSFDLPSFVLYPDPNDPYMFPIESDDWGHLGVSNRPDLVKAVHLPNPVTGADGDGVGYSLFYFYHADGLPALRLDSRGIAVRYIYDRSGNLLRLESDDGHLPLIDSLGMTDAQLPANAIEYAYDGLDRLVRAATIRDYADGTTHRVDTESVIEYDRLGAMVREYQSREGAVNTGTTRFVGYAWEREYAQTDYPNGLALRDNIDRIASITYPARVGTHDAGSHTPRQLYFGYGDPGSVSDLLGRVEKVTASGGPAGAPLTEIATYEYTGTDRLEAVLLGRPVGGTTGDHILKDERSFDGFGRVAGRTVTGWDGTGGSGYHDVMLSQFGHDLAGRRVFERLTQKDLNVSTPRNNTHSMFFGHDHAGRLVGERYGRLKTDGFEGIDHANSPTAPRVQSYGLDLLNRRVGDGSDPGLSVWTDTDKDGVVDAGEITLSHDHVVDKRGVLTGIDDGSTVASVSHDAAGSITQYDGRNVYHDWLGRPVLVTNVSNGNPVVAYTYDAFGRLAKRTAPWPSDATKQRIEEYHYDGVRRIQEVFHDPVHGTPPWPQLPGQGGGSTPQTRTEAEYIWSAAWGQPFDTCHVQIDWWDREAWFVQDHTTGTVRGYVDPSGEIVEQYGFDAFGNLIRRDEFTLVKTGSQGYYNTFRQRLGHQGLFADRLQGHTNQRVMATGVDMWYQSRSRWYAPELGRFVTADPNGTGITIQSSLASLGKMPAGPPSGSFGWEDQYGDGWDVFTAYGANPVQTQDPTGLFFFLNVGGAGAIRNTLGDMQFESGMNSMQGVAMVASGIGAQQAIIAMLADSAMGAAGAKVFAYGLDLAKGFNKTGGIPSSVYRGTDLYPDVGKIMPYREAQKLTAGHRGAIQAHHIVEKRFAETLGISDINGMPAVILTKGQHNEITQLLRNNIGYGQGAGKTGRATPDRIRTMYMEVYADYPELLGVVLGIVR